MKIRPVTAVSEFLAVDRLMQIMQERGTKFVLVVENTEELRGL